MRCLSVKIQRRTAARPRGWQRSIFTTVSAIEEVLDGWRIRLVELNLVRAAFLVLFAECLLKPRGCLDQDCMLDFVSFVVLFHGERDKLLVGECSGDSSVSRSENVSNSLLRNHVHYRCHISVYDMQAHQSSSSAIKGQTLTLKRPTELMSLISAIYRHHHGWPWPCWEVEVSGLRC
jgi:hypothetical protein